MFWLDNLVDAVLRGIARFGRKKVEPATREPFGRNHLLGSDGRCVYCGDPDPDETKPCPGPGG